MTLTTEVDPTTLSRISHPGNDRNLFLRHMLLRLTGGCELNKFIHQASPGGHEYDEMQAAEDYCKAFQWLGIPCTPDIVRGSSDSASQLQFLERVLKLAEAKETLCTPNTHNNSSSSTDFHRPHSTNLHSTHHSSATITSTSSMESDSLAKSTDSRRSLGTNNGSTDFGVKVGLSSGSAAPHSQLLEMLCERSSHLFLPPPALFPQDIAPSTSQPTSLQPEDIPRRLAELEQQLAGLNTARAEASEDEDGDDVCWDHERHAALHKLLSSFTAFMEAVNTFMRCCQQEVHILTQSSTPRPFLNLGPMSAAILAHHARLQAVISSISTLLLHHQACDRNSPQGMHLQESLQRLSQSAQVAIGQAAPTFKLKALKQL